MTPDTIATYRANYDHEAWERITQGWRLHVVPPGAILAINALCDEVERLQRELRTEQALSFRDQVWKLQEELDAVNGQHFRHPKRT